MFSAVLRSVSSGGAARSAAVVETVAATTVRRHTFSFASGASTCAPANKSGASVAAVAGANAFRQQQIQLAQGKLRRSVQTAPKVVAAATAPSPGLMAAVLAFPKAQPFAFNIAIATVKTSIADIITQVAIEQKEQIDWTRNGVFVVFGAVYLGGFQYWLQVNMFSKWFPNMARFANQSFSAKIRDTAGLIDTAKQVLFDVFIHLPLMYFPAFYAVKESVMGSSWSPVDWVRDGVTKYYNNFRKDFTAMFCLWAPADCIIFAVPLWLRLPVRHIVSLGWTSYLSFLRGSKDLTSEPKK
mmetsp:Transcript_26433/g.74382  ORF Transcript_26433/g.74382 Transcript_26433/m.74382 type:complete len:298 (+) Transcript_26433:93-986(+)|eukprot:CAMPEP_0117674010 /NCGR_PEP_ID=MMETSP0804-20121206/14797_1 /TAXON_ID=1074897 /ORGANISM="Tetraselmis astigmatica, Strain CCMP880" /LENGTH=297 /DNA_ID=CAMNT_0005482825 /DNA_START=48 /DNA_END=941 /DNA_ORIENTATION=-